MFEPVRQQWAGRPLDVPLAPTFRSTRTACQGTAAVDEREEAYARGHADALAAAQATLHAQRRAIDELGQSIADRLHLPPGSIEALLAEASRRIASALGVVSPERADAAVVALARAIRDECTPVAVHLHPDQVGSLMDAEIGVPLVADATVEAGAVRMRTASGWIEDGVPVRLARFQAALDHGGAA